MERLAEGLEALGVPFSQAQLDALLDYVDTLRHWNRAYNLVATGELDHLVSRHVLDGLSISPFIADGELLDVGTGAGIPGLPLAIMRPELAVTLLDSTGKKIRFLSHVVRRLGLDRVTPVHERVERFNRQPGFSTITSRAFASLRLLAGSARHLLAPGGRLLAMKGRYPADELDDLPGGITLDTVHRLAVPGLDAERHLVVMSVSD